MGMTGIDEEFALLKRVRADLSVNRKKLTDKELSEALEARTFANSGMSFATVLAA